MTTKELIQQLQDADPGGELQVVVSDNSAIHFAGTEEAYWDGQAQQLTIDDTNPFYGVVGAKYLVKGNKVRLHSLSIEAAISNNPDIPVDFSEIERHMPSDLEDAKKRVEKWRKETRDIIRELEEEDD